ncbi:MAG TPA: YncE family protein [Acidisarcina sp.]
MSLLRWIPFLCLAQCGFGQQAPWGRADIPVSGHDRVYAADQTSNTVSVIDPSRNLSLGEIRLGDPIPAALSPLYKGELLVHGLGYSPDSRTLAVVSVGSNSVTLIDTWSNRIKGKIYVGRSPHEAFFTTNGRELWVTVRGENYISVIDPTLMKEIRRIELANGPGMTSFGTDGQYAFVCSSFTPELSVLDVKAHRVIKRLVQASPFCPNIAVSPENDEVWITLKDAGKIQIFDAKPPFKQKAVLEIGPITNHVNFANNHNAKFAYVTIGGANQVKVYRRGPTPQLVATIPVGSLPHGIWPSGDGSRMYVALEDGDAAQVIDTLSNKVITSIPIGQTTQALVYVPNAIPSGQGRDNLTPLGNAGNTAHLHLRASGTFLPEAQASVAVNSLGLVDLIEIAAAGLMPASTYRVCLAESNHLPYGRLQELAILGTNPDGAGIVQAIGPLKSLEPRGEGSSSPGNRFVIVVDARDDSNVVLSQSDASTGRLEPTGLLR